MTIEIVFRRLPRAVHNHSILKSGWILEWNFGASEINGEETRRGEARLSLPGPIDRLITHNHWFLNLRYQRIIGCGTRRRKSLCSALL
jgi:hypothetical protein